jgi:hypothetical protein
LEHHPLGVVARDVDEGLAELVGQQPEAGDDAGPAPAALVEVHDLDLHRVARNGARDVDGARDRVDPLEIEHADVGCRGALVQLVARGVDGPELEFGARLDGEGGLQRVVPAEVVVVMVDGLEAAHLTTSLCSRTTRLVAGVGMRDPSSGLAVCCR